MESRIAPAKEMQVVYGGQWGSEGKGRIAVHLARQRQTPFMIAVRVGGPNAGHTIEDITGKTLKLQQIPVAAFASSGVTPVIGPSGLILPDLLKRELDWLNEAWCGDAPILYVDEQAMVITDEHMNRELGLKISIASTGEGVGAATADKVLRSAIPFKLWAENQASMCASESVHFWLDEKRIRYVNTQQMLTDPQESDLRRQFNSGMTIQLEGTQGYMLSLNAGRYYPFCTSRDCGPEALVAQCGLSMRMATNTRVIAVMRTYPIRVGGNSGPMGEEISWEELRAMTGGYVSEPERTTVTNKVRRIARWDDSLARRVALETHPTEVAITFADYLYPDLVRMWSQYGPKQIQRSKLDVGDDKTRETIKNLLSWVDWVQMVMNTPVTMVGVGPGHIINISQKGQQK